MLHMCCTVALRVGLAQHCCHTKSFSQRRACSYIVVTLLDLLRIHAGADYELRHVAAELEEREKKNVKQEKKDTKREKQDTKVTAESKHRLKQVHLEKVYHMHVLGYSYNLPQPTWRALQQSTILLVVAVCDLGLLQPACSHSTWARPCNTTNRR